MTTPGAPLCPRHDGEVSMRLSTLHTDASKPGQLVGLFECPDCGHERRHPVDSAEVA